jgi:predicted GIY-YIG superfamily endonuclease
MRYVYLLRSVSHSDQTYVGITDNLKRRLSDHNGGDSPHTAKWRPWKLVTAVAFADDAKAAAFEQYLKSGSGRAFATKHFW